jgi:hypothetical protein
MIPFAPWVIPFLAILTRYIGALQRSVTRYCVFRANMNDR